MIYHWCVITNQVFELKSMWNICLIKNKKITTYLIWWRILFLGIVQCRGSDRFFIKYFCYYSSAFTVLMLLRIVLEVGYWYYQNSNNNIIKLFR